MFADIATGHHELADALYLIAAILFAVAAVAFRSPEPISRVLAYAGAACLAVAFLVL